MKKIISILLSVLLLASLPLAAFADADGQESISSTLPASECPEGCLRLVCLPVELSGTPSSASVYSA